MRVYRVFPHRGDAAAGEPGHPLYIHPDQGTGRWDNPDLYRVLYLSSSAPGAVGESFAHLTEWSRAMLPFPAITGSHRSLGVYELDEAGSALLDLDDPHALVERGLRPTDIVKRNRGRTQEIARQVFEEAAWAGLSWWSMHRPEWVLHALWRPDALVLVTIEDLVGHPALDEAATLLAKATSPDLD